MEVCLSQLYLGQDEKDEILKVTHVVCCLTLILVWFALSFKFVCLAGLRWDKGEVSGHYYKFILYFKQAVEVICHSGV